METFVEVFLKISGINHGNLGKWREREQMI